MSADGNASAGIDAGAFTLSGDAAVEERVSEALAACVSSLRDAAGDAWAGAALAGPFAFGEAATWRDAEGRGVAFDPIEVVAVLSVPPHALPSHAKKLASALSVTARSRKVEALVRVLARDLLPYLPASLFVLECLAARRIVDGPRDLLDGARALGNPNPTEGLRLLVRSGGALLAAERALDRAESGAALLATRALTQLDRALGSVVLLSARRWVPPERERTLALRTLASRDGDDGRPVHGVQTRMTWTRFHDVVTRHRGTLEEAGGPYREKPLTEARQDVARAADRWLEVMRLHEEDRLAVSFSDWTAYAAALAVKRTSTSAELFDDAAPTTEGSITRREARRLTPLERLAPAVAALLDWNPADMGLVPILLDLSEAATRDALRQRATALSAGDV